MNELYQRIFIHNQFQYSHLDAITNLATVLSNIEYIPAKSNTDCRRQNKLRRTKVGQFRSKACGIQSEFLRTYIHIQISTYIDSSILELSDGVVISVDSSVRFKRTDSDSEWKQTGSTGAGSGRRKRSRIGLGTTGNPVGSIIYVCIRN